MNMRLGYFFIYFRYEDWEIELKYDLQRGVLGIRGVATSDD